MNFRLLSIEDLQRYHGFAKDSCQLTKCSAQALKASSQVVSLHYSKSSTKDEGNKLVKGLDGQLNYYFPVQPFKSEKSCENPQFWRRQKSGCTVTNPYGHLEAQTLPVSRSAGKSRKASCSLFMQNLYTCYT